MKLSYNDNHHAYWLDGSRCKGVSTIAKVPDDTYNLVQWGKRTVALGMALNPSLAERAVAHHDDKSELNKIAEDALRAARANEAADRGTAIHRLLERFDLGEDVIETDETRAWRAAYNKALAAAGLTVVDEYVERIVVYPGPRIAGRFDRIYRRKRDGKLVIGDVKSGTNAVRYPHSTAIQLALYANAPLMAGPIPRDGGSTEDFSSMPEKLDLKWGYIVHAPEAEKVEVLKVDIAAAWKLTQTAVFNILEWRKRTDLIAPISSIDIEDPDRVADEDRTAWIHGRLNIIKHLAPAAKEAVVNAWPHGVAPKGPWSDNDVDQLDQMLALVEKNYSASFPIEDPAITQGAVKE
jgi:hypothetical protein